MPGISKASHGGFLVCCVLLAFTAPVGGATFNVNSTTDLGDSNPGDGVCSASGVFCTLRAAIEESNELGGSHTINLPNGVYLLTLGELEVLTDIDLQGAGAASCVVDGNNSSRVFNVDSFTMRASGLTVQNGNANNYGGGGFRIAPSTATLILEDAVVRNNSTVSGGAGIMNEGTLSITRTILSGNASPSGGGAIWSVGTLTVFATEITGNTSSGGYGGGLLLTGSAELTDVTISGNTAAGYFWVDRWLGGDHGPVAQRPDHYHRAACYRGFRHCRNRPGGQGGHSHQPQQTRLPHQRTNGDGAGIFSGWRGCPDQHRNRQVYVACQIRIGVQKPYIQERDCEHSPWTTIPACYPTRNR